MITLKTLKWSGCFSYGGDNTLSLEDNTLTQLVGVNGHGKSSIPLILEEAFYNKNSKGIKKASIPNRYLDGGYSIYVSFQKDEDIYEVTVSRKATIKIKLEKNGEDISSHTATNTYKTIEDILGLDFKTFSQLIYQNTNASLQFLTATDTARKKFLIDLLHLEEYVRLFEIFKEAAKASSIKLNEAQTKVSTIKNWLDSNKLDDTTILPLVEIEITTEEDEKEVGRLTAELENISQKNKKIQANNQYKTAISAINIDKINSIPVTSKVSYDLIQSTVGTFKGTLSSSQAMITKMNKLGHICPTCTQSIDENVKSSIIQIEQEKIKEAEVRIKEYEDEIKSIQEANKLFDHKIKSQKEWEDLWRNIDSSLPTTIIDRTELERSITEVRSRLSSARSRLSELARENEQRTKRNTRIQIVQEQSDKFILLLSEAQETLDKETELNSKLELLKKSFSTNGLLAYKIENLVKELELITNKYLTEFSDGRFTLEFVIVSDKLNVVITDSGVEIELEALSTGELARVNTAALLAIRKLMSSISKSRLNILFLDEVISTLDDFGKEKLVEILLQEEGLNTFIVSHGWTHPLVNVINVVKENNISRLE